jgi:DNA repair exonuclease SbcCD nuclease subunit
MKKVSFIHAADLHLDSPMVGLRHLPDRIFNRLRESTFQSLKKITRAAIEQDVDFVILAGDLFDGEDRSLRAQSRLRTEMLKLEEKGIPVFVVHGNHDHLSGSWVHLDMPPNVHIFTSDVEIKTVRTKQGVLLHFYGFSYPKRHVLERKIDDYIKQEGADFHIGILHGNEGGVSEHGNYAPFTVSDLLEKQFDYWALGHIHKRAVISNDPPIIYPGNIQGRNKKETGIKGCYHVTLSDTKNDLKFIETSDVVWEEAVIDSAATRNFQEILQMCQATMETYRKRHHGTLLSLTLKNIQMEDSKEEKFIDGELVELLQEEEREEDSFVWIVDINLEHSQNMDRKQLEQKAEFFRELFETVDHYDNVEHTLESLYNHRLGKKYLSQLSPTDQADLLQKAQKLLINLLYQS